MSDNPQLQVMQQLGRTYRALMSAFEANIGQSMPRWRILLHLHESGEASQKQLALALRMDPAALTRQIQVIENKGWVERHNDASDNRLTNVALTAQGRKVVEQTLPRRTAFIERALGDLSPRDMQALGTMLSVLEQRLRQEAASPARPDR
ncbi:MAG: MarR family winged helix-turn-helix transcriptional regulator [Pollutimonas bauzanensis]|uniref:DNA-binding transcriptional regulator, MarR family n=1 Tax=Pollutimonas bauzanensis TaxID=658167 RepID=A0A1M5ZVY5_9BURK|nr:MarR family winged helix-turn-helix transcriptional regulator [Pollutimonas bauzanensis]SHI28083.1 DNA-binding transcriptional regulator, MarR family [Pollutimonas bauzanensis]